MGTVYGGVDVAGLDGIADLSHQNVALWTMAYLSAWLRSEIAMYDVSSLGPAVG